MLKWIRLYNENKNWNWNNWNKIMKDYEIREKC